MTTTWNSGDKTSGITLTDSDHHAENTTTGANHGVRATTSHSSGKWYLEYSNNVLSGFHQRRGFATAAQDLTDYSTAHMFGVTEGGGADGSGGSLSAVAGEIIQLIIDIDAGTYQYKKVGDTNWLNAGGSAGPVGTFPIDYTSIIPAGTAIYPAFVTFSNSGQLGATTINCGDRAFAETPPAGYVGWDVPATATWNSADKDSAITLSNSDQTATTTGGDAGVRGVDGRDTGKLYLEFQSMTNGGLRDYRGFANATASLTSKTSDQFGIDDGGGPTNSLGGGSSSLGSPAGQTLGIAIDIDSGEFTFTYDGSTWYKYNPFGSAANPTTNTNMVSYTSVISAGSVIYPWCQMLDFGTQPFTTLATHSADFVHSIPSGYTAWADGTPPTPGDGDATGVTITSTVSLIAGTGYIPVDASVSGVTLTTTASMPTSGEAAGGAIDGSKIFEFTFAFAQTNSYQEVDYFSIYSKGNRAGILTFGDVGWSAVFGTMASGFDNNTSGATGNGPAASGSIGSFSYVQFPEPVDVRGFRLVGNDNIAADINGQWTFRGGFNADAPSDSSYATEFDAFVPQQGPAYLPDTVPTNLIRVSEFPTTPRGGGTLYDHFQFKYVSGTRTEVRWCNDIEFLIAHSNLDGGDRRPTNGRPEKQVVFTMSSDWTFNTGTDKVDPQDGLFDGLHEYQNSFNTTLDHREVQIYSSSNAGADHPQITPGEWWQFDFPRPVTPRRMILETLASITPEVYDSGDNPTRWGLWHWAHSEDGVAWTDLAQQWSFSDQGPQMFAPRDFSMFDIDVAALAPGKMHWRMVLDAGPAAGASQNLSEIIFQLDDPTDQAPPLKINFSDDDTSTLAPTIGVPSSPFLVAFSDTADDGITFTFTNIPNPVLTVAYTDDAQFDTYSDLYPSMVVQTNVVITGR